MIEVDLTDREWQLVVEVLEDQLERFGPVLSKTLKEKKEDLTYILGHIHLKVNER